MLNLTSDSVKKLLRDGCDEKDAEEMLAKLAQDWLKMYPVWHPEFLSACRPRDKSDNWHLAHDKEKGQFYMLTMKDWRAVCKGSKDGIEMSRVTKLIEGRTGGIANYMRRLENVLDWTWDEIGKITGKAFSPTEKLAKWRSIDRELHGDPPKEPMLNIVV